MSVRKFSPAPKVGPSKRGTAASGKAAPSRQQGSGENPPADPPRQAQRNANAYTGFVIMSALSTALFLTGAGLTVHSGLRYAKSAGTEALLRAAGKNADQLFDRSGELTQDAKTYSEGVPGLYGMLQNIEKRAETENVDIQKSIHKMKSEAREDRQTDQKRLRDSAIVAGCGVVGMLIFIAGAKIIRHRGHMLFDANHRPRVQAQIAPRLSPQEFGAALTLRF